MTALEYASHVTTTGTPQSIGIILAEKRVPSPRPLGSYPANVPSSLPNCRLFYPRCSTLLTRNDQAIHRHREVCLPVSCLQPSAAIPSRPTDVPHVPALASMTPPAAPRPRQRTCRRSRPRRRSHPRRAHDHVAGSGGGRGGGRAVGGMHGDLREREAIEQACPCVSNDDKAHTGRLRVRRPGAYRCQWHTRSVKAKCTTLELVRAQADACMV